MQPPAKYLLPELIISDYGKKCVVIDLDETLVHSSFKVRAAFKIFYFRNAILNRKVITILRIQLTKYRGNAAVLND